MPIQPAEIHHVAIDTTPAPPSPSESPEGEVKTRFPWYTAIRRRIISGLFFALPIAITLWIVYYLVSTLQSILLDPVAGLVRRVFRAENIEGLPWWWRQFVSPVLSLMLVLVLLYFLGYFGRSRIYRMVDWLLLRVPIVTVIYKAVRNVVSSLDKPSDRSKFKRVVLVPFPNETVRAPAFVTNTTRDESTGQTVLIVYLPYAPIPTQGILMTVLESDVVDLNWDVHQTMQLVISFGLSTPDTIRQTG